MASKRKANRLVFELLEARQLLAADLGMSGSQELLAAGISQNEDNAGSAVALASSESGALSVESAQQTAQLALPDDLPASFSATVEYGGETLTLNLHKHTIFGENTRFLVDDGSGELVEIDHGVDRSYMGVVEERLNYSVNAILTPEGLQATIIRPGLSSLRVDPTPFAAGQESGGFGSSDSEAASGVTAHVVYEEEASGAALHHDHDGDGIPDHSPADHPNESGGGHPPGCGCVACCGQTDSATAAAFDAVAFDAASSSGGGGSLDPPAEAATLPPSRVIEVREFEVGVEIGSPAFLNNYGGSISNAMSAAMTIPGNMDARYLHGVGIKHVLGTVIIRTSAAEDKFTVANGNDSAGLSAFRNYWNSNPQEVGTTHDMAVYHVRASPSGLAYVNQVGTSSRYALSASNGPTSWANGTLVHEFGHTWSLGHVPGNPSSTFYESKPRSNGSAAGGDDVFVSVMHGGGSHNIGRLSSGEANQVYNVSLGKTQFSDLVTPGPVKPFGNVDTAATSGSAIIIDVIANDYDANNDVLELELRDTVSQLGGTVSLSVGTGPGGRNQILYTPPIGVNGTDLFHYTVRDSTGLGDWGAVYVANEGPVVIDTNQTKFDYDFGTSTSPVLTSSTVDWQRISPNTTGDIFWSTSVSAVDRGSGNGANDANRDFVTSTSAATLEHKVANGLWSVVLNMGDANAAREDMTISAEGQLITGNIDSPAGQFSYVSSAGGSATPTGFEVTVTDGSLSLTIDDVGGADPSWVLNRMTLSLIDAGPQTLEVYVDPVTGRGVLRNDTQSDISFDGYLLEDTVASLKPEGWFSLQDQAYDAGIWFEAAPSATQLPELTMDGETTLAPGDSVYLGTIVNPAMAQDLTFEYYRASSSEQTQGVIRFESPGVPLLPGDYSGDFIVNAADYTIYRDQLGDQVASFSGADGNGNGIIDRADYLLWKSSYGDQATFQTLIDATTGNGEFAVDDAADVSGVGIPTEDVSISVNRDRALSQSDGSSIGEGVAIDGWQITRVAYPGGSSAIGVDGRYGFAVDAGTGPGETGQAFVNSGAAQVKSDTINAGFSPGDIITLSYLLGTNSASGAASVQAEVSLVFDEGLGSETTHTFDVVTATGLSTPAIVQNHSVVNAASTLSVEFLLDGVESDDRTLLDSVNLSVTTIPLPALTAALLPVTSRATDSEQALPVSAAVVDPHSKELRGAVNSSSAEQSFLLPAGAPETGIVPGSIVPSSHTTAPFLSDMSLLLLASQLNNPLGAFARDFELGKDRAVGQDSDIESFFAKVGEESAAEDFTGFGSAL